MKSVKSKFYGLIQVSLTGMNLYSYYKFNNTITRITSLVDFKRHILNKLR